MEVMLSVGSGCFECKSITDTVEDLFPRFYFSSR